jgi:hypothetical protein
MDQPSPHGHGRSLHATLAGAKACFVALALLLSPQLWLDAGDAPKKGKVKNSWIWTYARPPHQAGNGAASFLQLLSLSERCRDGKNDQRFIDALMQFGGFKESGLKLEPTHIFPLSAAFYYLTVGGQPIKADQRKALYRCIIGLVQREVTRGDRQSLDRLAQGLLLLGYQVSCKGEDVVINYDRLLCWQKAITVLLKTHPQDRVMLQARLEVLQREAKDVNWTDGELRHPVD